MLSTRYIYTIATAVVCASMAFFACKKDIKPVAETNSIAGKAFIKLVHAAPSFRNLFNAADTFHVYVNDQKVNALSLTYGSAYPTAGSTNPANTSNGYAAIDPGVLNIRFFIPGTVKPDSIALFSMTKTVAANQYYSLIVTDSIRSSKDSLQIVLRDDFETPPPNLYTMRFVHALMNDTAARRVDVYSARRNGNIYTNFAAGNASPFLNYAYNGIVPDTLIVRRSGTTIELARLNTITFGHQRVYSLYYRGLTDSLPTARRASRTLTYYVNK